MNKAEALKVEPGQLIAPKAGRSYHSAYYGVARKVLAYHEKMESFEVELEQDPYIYMPYYVLRQLASLPKRVLIKHRDAVLVTEEMLKNEEYRSASTVYADAKTQVINLVNAAYTLYATEVSAVLARRMAIIQPLIKVEAVKVDGNCYAYEDLNELPLHVTLKLPLDVTASMFSWINAENAMAAKATDKDSWELPSKQEVYALLTESERYKLAVKEYHAARARYAQAAAEVGIEESSIVFSAPLKFIKIEVHHEQ